MVEPQREAAFLDFDEAFDTDTIVARAGAAYDLLNRKQVNIPDWIDAETELWQDIGRGWGDDKPDDIAMRVTVENLSERYSEVRRSCDLVSHIFIRVCPNCLDPDPLNLRLELSRHGMKQIDPPHEFLANLRN